jgi:hypothetical protein
VSTASVSPADCLERVRRLLEEEQGRKLYGTVTVFYQAGTIERVEVKRTSRVGDLK